MSGTRFAKRHDHHLGFIPFPKALSLGLYCGKLDEVKKRSGQRAGREPEERKEVWLPQAKPTKRGRSALPFVFLGFSGRKRR